MAKKICIIIIAVVFLLVPASLLFRARPGESVALIRIEEEIRESKSVIERLEKARENPLIRGVVIYLNTPGGAVVPCQEMVDEINRLRDGGKVVVASLGIIAASGGYYIASAADRIVANPGTITGSIGVIMELPSVEELTRKIGVEMRVIKSRKYKDIASPFREMENEERELLQDVVNDVYNQFVDEVVKGRGIERDSVLKIADGRIFSGKKAKEFGFVDTLGSLKDAIAIAGDLAGMKGKPAVIELKERKIPLVIRLLSSIYERKNVKLEYIFRP
ncbi:signal peptide peptidase SppA [candidate division WOR-3 bacterium JGI_Cruoil_03_44_89]|uniref:Signal peptide peptidase SppA n=1 Tax=candidate division WOR-3 bacterium JGI_Cruoil_03_44_89 TaxID=1973748 RepID=A0A235BSC8_UNCW3|nr:MAG: signal peptide peptidase SppA [candidate division WOR-3 bacterium JGI_Cruoil_03_44_89]